MNDPRAPHDLPLHGASAPGAAGDGVAMAPQESALTVPVIVESVHVEKVEIDRGGYRLTKRVDLRDVIVDEPLRHETVTIDRCPVDRQLAEGEVPTVRYEGDTMIVPVVKEIVVTQRRLVLVEEIRIVRVHGTHRDPQSVAVREEHVEIERLGAEPSVIRSS